MITGAIPTKISHPATEIPFGHMLDRGMQNILLWLSKNMFFKGIRPVGIKEPEHNLLSRK
jgi:hypothetical protein